MAMWFITSEHYLGKHEELLKLVKIHDFMVSLQECDLSAALYLHKIIFFPYIEFSGFQSA